MKKKKLMRSKYDKFRDTVVRRLAAGDSVADIGAAIGVGPTNLYPLLRRWGLQTPTQQTPTQQTRVVQKPATAPAAQLSFADVGPDAEVARLTAECARLKRSSETALAALDMLATAVVRAMRKGESSGEALLAEVQGVATKAVGKKKVAKKKRRRF